MSITYAWIQMIGKIVGKTDRARIITKARAHKLLMSDTGACIGLMYEKAGQALRDVGGLVLDANGKRFANGLGRRVYVTGEMW